MFYQASLFSTPNATSSPESESGATHCDKPDGQMIGQSGQAHVLVNHSARQAKEQGLLTSGIYGQHSTGSSSSVNLMLFLASKLRARTDLLGSTLFGLTWKQRTTPSGRSICALRASARRTSDSDCSSWPTPKTSDVSGGMMNRTVGRSNLNDHATLASWPTPRTVTGGAESAERKQELGRTASGGGDLQAAAQLASWPTPRANESNESLETQQAREMRGTHASKNLDSIAQLASWNTPRATDGTHGGPNQAGGALSSDAALASWVTPTQRDHRDGDCQAQIEAGTVPVNALLGRQAQLTATGEEPNGSTAATGSTGQLNPALARWLMGLPREWCEAAIRARRSMRTTRRKPVCSGSQGTETP